MESDRLHDCFAIWPFWISWPFCWILELSKMWLDVALFCNLAGGLLTFQYFAIIWKLRAGSKRVAGVSPEASGKHKWHKRAIRNVPDASSIDAGILTSIALWSLKHDFFASKCKLKINILSLVILRRVKFRSSGEKMREKVNKGPWALICRLLIFGVRGSSKLSSRN